jgi:hypothetical protein
MLTLFIVIVAAIVLAPIIKAVGKIGIVLLLSLIGIVWIGSQFGGSTTAPTVTTTPTTIQTASTPAPPTDPAIEQDNAHLKPIDPDKLRADIARTTSSGGSSSPVQQSRNGGGLESAGTPKVELTGTDWSNKAPSRITKMPNVKGLSDEARLKVMEEYMLALQGQQASDKALGVDPDADAGRGKKHSKSTHRAKAKAEAKTDAAPTIREHVDEILDAPDPKTAVRAYADWLDELNEQIDDQDQD